MCFHLDVGEWIPLHKSHHLKQQCMFLTNGNLRLLLEYLALLECDIHWFVIFMYLKNIVPARKCAYKAFAVTSICLL